MREFMLLLRITGSVRVETGVTSRVIVRVNLLHLQLLSG